MKAQSTIFSTISLIRSLLFILLFPILMQAQFKNIVWYEQWCQAPFGQDGYTIQPHQIDWTGVNVIVHFDNDNINTNASPYLAYINRGNAYADSVSLFRGGSHDLAYVDSLVACGHRAGAAVVLSLTAVDPAHLYAMYADSTRTETFVVATAKFLERHGYDGVDVNVESYEPNVTYMARFIRRLRLALNTWVTTPHSSLTRPWFSITTPVSWLYDGSYYPLALQDKVDMFCVQITTSNVWDGTCNNNVNYFNWITRLGRGAYSYSQSRDQWLVTLTEDAPWIPAGNKPLGIRGAVKAGYNKSRLAPAQSVGGTAALMIGSDSLFGCANDWRYDVNRSTQNALLTHGGSWKWDAYHQSSYISGTATSNISSLSITTGQKFFAGSADSATMYYSTKSLIDSGYGGIAPYSLAFDLNTSSTTKRFGDRFPAHAGILAAVAGRAPTSILTVSPTALSSFGNIIVNATSSEKTYTVSGSNLTPASGNITVTAPTGFRISKTTGSGFTTSLTYAYTGGLLSASTVYVRFQPTAAQSYSGNITHAGGGATTINTVVSGSGVLITGTLTATPQTLPSSGGTVTLRWTSQNATVASIDQGVGTVSLNGSTNVNITSTKTFILTLSNSTTSVQYSANVQVLNSQGTGSDEVIYQDIALTSQWNDIRSWSIVRNYNSASPVYNGNSALQLTHSPWASLQFSKGTWAAFEPIDPSPYNNLSFAVHGGSAGVTIQVTCVDNNNIAQKPAVNVIAPANTWIVVSIPMNQLATASFTAIAFTALGANTVFSIDNIYITLDKPISLEKTIVTAIPDTIIANAVSTSNIIVQLKDSLGNNLSNSGDTVSLKTTLGALSPVTDNGDGTYKATLTSATTLGTATVSGTINSKEMTNTASIVFRCGPASPATSKITASPDTLLADGTSTSIITVQLKDAYGNNITTGGNIVTLATTSGILSSVTDNRNGSFSAVLTSATTNGTANISAVVNSQICSNSISVIFKSVPIVTPYDVIYHDNALTLPWSDCRSWSITRNYTNNALVYQGHSSLLLNHSPWASLQFSKGTWGNFTLIDPANYKSFTFAIHGGTAGVKLQLRCVNNNNVAQKPAVKIIAAANKWTVMNDNQ